MRFNDAGIFPALWWRIGTRGIAARFPVDAGGFAAVLSHIGDLRRTHRRDERGQEACLCGERGPPCRSGGARHKDYSGGDRRAGRSRVCFGLGSDFAGPYYNRGFRAHRLAIQNASTISPIATPLHAGRKDKREPQASRSPILPSLSFPPPAHLPFLSPLSPPFA